MAESFKLPTSLYGRSDMMKLIRELNSLNDFFVGAAARQTGSTMQVPKTTQMLNQLAELNRVNLIDTKARKDLAAASQSVLQNAPSVHMSFASEANPKTLEPVLVWLRSNIHPQLLLQVGVQPSIAAGCRLRTANKIYDFSLRTYLEKQSGYLMALVTESVNGG